MAIETYFIQIGKMLEIVFPDHEINLTVHNHDGYCFYIYKGHTDEERYENPTYKLILNDVSDDVKANIDKRNKL